MADHQPTALLRQVDGLSHLVLGPVVLLATPWLAGPLGMRTWPLAVFVAAFTLYGIPVVLGTRRRAGRRTWVLAAAVNAAFAATVVMSMILNERLTALGLWLHGAVLAGSLLMLALSCRELRASAPGAGP